MSSTSNAQNLLVNVVRPTYRWDSNTGFVPSVTLSNLSEVIASKIQTGSLVVSDLNVNAYIGSNAGVNASNTASNVALGYSAMGGALNARENVAVGAFSLEGLSNSSSNVAIGSRTDIAGAGLQNVLIGPGVTMGDGSGNILIGVDLSIGNVSKTFRLGSLLYGDLSSGFLGVNTSAPQAAFDISGTTVFRGKVGFQNPNPTYSLDVNGSVYANGQFFGGDGTVANPLFTFVNSSNSGMYVPIPTTLAGTVDLCEVGVGAFGIATNSQVAAIFTSNKSYFMKDLDVSGTFTARSVNLGGFAVSNGTASQPSVTFTSDNSSGLFLAASNILGVSTGGVRRIAVLSNGDISMGRLLGTDISVSGTILASSGSNSIGGVTLSNGFVITTGTTTSSNLLVPGYLRNSDPATTLDISGGNISNSGTTTSSNLIVPGYLRNALTPSQFDISGGNITIGGRLQSASAGTLGSPTVTVGDVSSGIFGGSSTVGVSIAGVRTALFLSNIIDFSNSGVQTLSLRNQLQSTAGTVGTPAYSFATDTSTGFYRAASADVRYTTQGIDRVFFQGSQVGIGAAPAATLDVCGTVRARDGILSPTYIRDLITPSTLDISGGTISNSALTRSSNFRGSNGSVSVPTYSFTADGSMGFYRAAANDVRYATQGIDRVIFQNNQVGIGVVPGTAMDVSGIARARTGIVSLGYFRHTTGIGDLDISEGNITYSGAISNTTAASINRIGGVTLSNSNALFGNGTRAAPALTFSDVSTGFYRESINSVTISVAGVKTVNFSNTLTEFSNNGVQTLWLRDNQLQSTNGSVSAPAYSYASDTSTGFYRIATGHIAFGTLGLGRIGFSNANVGIGVTSPTFQLQLSTDSAAKPTTNTWTISSDRRIKQNIERADISLCYDLIKQLPLQRFTWDSSFMPDVPDKRSVGWIAQDVKTVFPNAVTCVSNTWFDDFHGLDVDQLYKTMYGALEKVIADKEAMEAQLQSVLARLTALEASLQSSG